MPLTRIDIRAGKSREFKAALFAEIYEAMRETCDVPEEDRFMVITEHTGDTFSFSRNYLGIERSDDLVIIQITVSNTRPTTQKQRLYRRIVEKLTANPGLRPEDIFINLVEVLPENWSFGHGEAQYVR